MLAGTQLDDPTCPPTLACRSVSRTHVGRVRLFNEDRVFADPAAGVWAVADGMGGHSGGDLAAQQIVDSLRQASVEPMTGEGVRDALQQANGLIHARNRSLRLNAGATVVTAVLADGKLEIAWAGDSRAYRLVDGRAELLSHDHSVVQQLVDAGVISAAMAERHPHANVVTRALGTDSMVVLDSVTVDARASRFLLCSDGLSRSLRLDGFDPDMPLDQLADTLLSAALADDGSDNVSLVLIEVF